MKLHSHHTEKTKELCRKSYRERRKTEPLKGKGIEVCPNMMTVKQRKMHFDNDIRSAVEWLKEEIVPEPHHLSWDKCSCGGCERIRIMNDKINKAFEDVM